MKVMVSVVVMSLLLLYVWERVDLVRVGYRIQQLKATHVALQRVNDELNVKVSALTSPERIERIAIERLGMSRPEPGQVILVSLQSKTPALRNPIEWPVRLVKNDLDW